MATTFLDTRQLSTNWLDGAHRRRMALAIGAVLLLSLAIARLVLALDLGALSILAVCVGIAVIVVQPRYGLYAIFAIVLLFEGGGNDPLMTPGLFLNKSLQSSFGASGAILIPLEMMLLLTTAVWLSKGLVLRRLDFRGGALGKPVLFFCLFLVYGVVRGVLAGATFNFAFWESRFLFQAVLCYVLAANTIRTRAHVQSLMTLILVCVTMSGIEGIWRKFVLIDAGQLGSAQEGWYAHESVVTWGLLIMLVFAQQAFGAPRWQRILGPIMLVITGYTMLLSERRAGYIAVMIAFLAYAVVLLIAKRKAFFWIAIPIFVATAFYLPAFWNNTGVLGQPARAVRSLNNPDPRDAASNIARDLEAINVRATIAADPLLGIGFGRPFLQVVAIPDISGIDPFWNVEAHHDVLGVWMKIGAVGFTLFFVVMCRGVARSAQLIRRLKDANAKVFASATISTVVMTLTFCYVDLGLTAARVPIVLGTMLGVMSVLDRIYTDAAVAKT